MLTTPFVQVCLKGTKTCFQKITCSFREKIPTVKMLKRVELVKVTKVGTIHLRSALFDYNVGQLTCITFDNLFNIFHFNRNQN